MIRAVFIAATVLVAVIVAPASWAPGFNSADAIVCLAPLVIVGIATAPARTERRPVSNRFIEHIPDDHPETLGGLDRLELYGKDPR